MQVPSLIILQEDLYMKKVNLSFSRKNTPATINDYKKHPFPMLTFLLAVTQYHYNQGNICMFSSVFITTVHLRITFVVAVFTFFVQLVSTAHVYICFEQLSSKFK